MLGAHIDILPPAGETPNTLPWRLAPAGRIRDRISSLVLHRTALNPARRALRRSPTGADTI